MSHFTTFHDGVRFKAETNRTRGSYLVTNRARGEWLYVNGADGLRILDALVAGWEKFGPNADGDDVWQWIWVNCGFYRLASNNR